MLPFASAGSIRPRGAGRVGLVLLLLAEDDPDERDAGGNVQGCVVESDRSGCIRALELAIRLGRERVELRVRHVRRRLLKTPVGFCIVR